MARTKLGLLTQEFADLNPWWRSTRWTGDDPDLRQARDTGLTYEADCLRDLQPGGLYVLRGPRRVGKTVASKQAIARLTAASVPGSSIVRVAVDGWSANDLRSVIQNVTLPLIGGDARRWWFIDEITSVAGDWAATIKWLRDNHAPFRDATVVITGSNASKLTEAIGLWAGRRGGATGVDRTMLPIGFRTFVNLLLPSAPEHVGRLPLIDLRSPMARDAYHELLPWLGDLTRMWDRYLLSGGFPVAVAAARRGEPIPATFIDDTFNVIFKDVFRDSLASETATTDLFARVIEGMGNPANLRQIGEAVDMSHQTVARHIAYLGNGYLAWSCPQKNERSWLPFPKAQSKVYAVDPLLARLPHLRQRARADVDITILNEMMLGVAVRRAATDAGRSWSGDEFLFFHRTPARKEIDFVSPLLGEAAIEGKFIEDGTWRSAAATVDASGWRGVLGTRNVLDTNDPDRAWAVPSGVLAYLIDT